MQRNSALGNGPGSIFLARDRAFSFNPKEMRAIDVATMSIGQGIAVTPLQMVQAYSALANGGQMVKPHIIKEIKNPDGSDYKVNQTEISGKSCIQGSG